MGQPRDKYAKARVWAGIFVASILGLVLAIRYEREEIIRRISELFGDGDTQQHSLILLWIPLLMAATSAIGTISAVILAWKSEGRNAREQRLRMEQMEFELRELRRKTESSTAKKDKKKVR